MENQLFVTLVLLAIIVIVAFISLINRNSFLKKKLNLLTKMFHEEAGSLDSDDSLKVLQSLKAEIIPYYMKRIEEWGPVSIGDVYLRFNKMDADRKILLESLFKAAIAALSNEKLVMIYLKAIDTEPVADSLEAVSMLQVTKNLILEDALKEGKSSGRVKVFFDLLNSQTVKLVRDKSTGEVKNILLIKAEIYKAEKALYYKSDINLN